MEQSAQTARVTTRHIRSGWFMATLNYSRQRTGEVPFRWTAQWGRSAAAAAAKFHKVHSVQMRPYLVRKKLEDARGTKIRRT